MKKIVTAVALAIALPSVAHAQETAEPATSMPCCEKMKAEGKECCCKDMAGKEHAGHDMKQHDGQPSAHDAHQH